MIVGVADTHAVIWYYGIPSKCLTDQPRQKNPILEYSNHMVNLRQ